MMNAGKTVIDISSSRKKNLTVQALLEAFEHAGGGQFANGRMMLG